ncbi:arabinogalactan oligomer/maltooligosaccharide transport system permease protein [Nonomuraea thailandensis]|uniref:Maltose/maltodextrin transport system permease protein n=1 Tax=Nonomuraea thailandensis TaxID=1188745 RepID=A0A9X2GK67_9ACTN|nr:ABC transporter permease subunit [Nonomuraea thailandensis]MCP2359089.1 arabinogalactan oligomer/maltooligosaccharide transport system permease protein [Nonomuraea thailandensis]
MALDVRQAAPAGVRERPRREITTAFVVSRIAVLAVAAAILLYAAPPLAAAGSWVALGLLCAVSAVIAYLYLTRRFIPAKYLIPGTVFLIAFQVFPVVYTLTTAFTNFGDGHRGDKAAAVTAIETGSVRQAPGSPEYTLSVATRGEELVFLLVDPATKQVSLGTADGLTPLRGARVGVTGKVLAAPGLTVLKAPEAAARGQEVTALAVPTGDGVIKANGLSRAVEGKAALVYDAACDCVRGNGDTWTADESQGYFVNARGEHLAQGWQVNVGLDNFARVLTNPTISGYFAGVLGWNLVFALVSVLGCFGLGMGVALALHHPRMRGTRFYRIVLILPYAMPAFAMLLVWRDMFNRDFGLINQILGAEIDWLGQTGTARLGVLLVNIWLGFPYMFLVTTGALQAIPRELTEAASIDGATPFKAFRRVTLPLLLVALTPLLISAFAYNFNNYNAIALTTDGGPFPADSPQVGGTDLLITYTFRLAFGAGGAQFGFAAAISVFIFAIVAVISAVAFRRTRRQEEVYA